MTPLMLLAMMLPFQEFKPLRHVDAPSPTLADILSHVPPEKVYKPEGGDLEVQAHETTHAINHMIRGGREGINAFYVPGNRVIVFYEPKVRLSAVAQAVPEKYRGDYLYKLYCVHAQQWYDQEPLFLVDELTAYVNGAQVATELRHRDVSYILTKCERMLYFCRHLQKLIAEKDPEYPQAKVFGLYLDYTQKRIEALRFVQ